MAARRPVVRDLALFDGSSTEILEQIEAAGSGSRAWVDDLLEAALRGGENARSGAIWLLRRTQRRGVEFSDAQVASIIAVIPLVSRWDQTLNLLQVLEGLKVPARLTGRALEFAYRESASSNAFIRAWALSVLIKLGLHRAGHRARIESLLSAAATDKPAVRARIRRALAEAEQARGGSA